MQTEEKEISYFNYCKDKSKAHGYGVGGLSGFGHFYTRILRNSLWKEHYDEFPSFTAYVFTEDRKEKAVLLRTLKKELNEFLLKYPKYPKEKEGETKLDMASPEGFMKKEEDSGI